MRNFRRGREEGPQGLTVTVRNDDVNKAIRIFKKKVAEAKKAPASSTTPTKKKAEPSARVKALKSSEAVKANAPVAKKVPTKTALLKLTKANIEIEARDHGIELDARKTKENMVADFQKAAKANAKAAIK